MKKSPFRQTTLALRSPQGGVRPGRWRLDGRGISLQCNKWFLRSNSASYFSFKILSSPAAVWWFSKNALWSSSSMRSISVMDNLKSKTSKLDFICSKLVAFGNGMMPRWICQRKMIWCFVFPYFSAKLLMIGWSNIGWRSRVNGDHAIPTTWCLRINCNKDWRWLNGWHSIWFTTGFTLQWYSKSMRRSS